MDVCGPSVVLASKDIKSSFGWNLIPSSCIYNDLCSLILGSRLLVSLMLALNGGGREVLWILF